MTQPTGKCFISYRRTHLEEVNRLILALRAVGIPTWQDLRDLKNLPTEDEIRRILKSDEISSAILFITDDVAGSEIIRSVEAKLILERASAKDGFFVIPIVADGLSYDAASKIFSGSIGVHDLKSWNLHRLKSLELDEFQAMLVASMSLASRLSVLEEKKKKGEALRLWASTKKAAPENGTYDLKMDWSHAFEKGLPGVDVWEGFLLPSLGTVVTTIENHLHGRPVEAEGFLSLPTGLAFGLRPAGWTGVTR